MLKKQSVKIAAMGIFLLVLLFSAFAPAAAGPLAGPPVQDITPMPTGLSPDPDITVVVPETGGDADNSASLSWLLWVLLIVIVTALIIGVVSRPRTL